VVSSKCIKMPIEIKEVIIRTKVEKEPHSEHENNLNGKDFETLKTKLLKSCEQMLRNFLKEQTGR